MPAEKNVWKENNRDGFNVICMLAAGHATTIAPIFRRGQGIEAFGRRGLVGALILIFTFGLSGDRMIGAYFVFWLAVLAARRIEAWRMQRRGEKIHSLSDGWPIFCDWLGVGQELGRALEVGACLMVALGLKFLADAYHLPWHGLAFYIGLGAVSISWDFIVRRKITNRQLHQMLDAKLEQEMLMERFHQWQGK